MSEPLTFSRGKDRDDPDAEQLRLSIDEYEGKRYVSARIWFRGRDGEFLPTKRGITLRSRELDAAIKWLVAAQKQLEAPAKGESNRDWVRRTGGKTASVSQPDLPPDIEEQLF